MTSGFPLRPLAVSALMLLFAPAPAVEAATSGAMVRLLQVLRDRGSISAAEYEELRTLAEAPEPVVAASEADVAADEPSPPAQASAPASDAQAQEAAMRTAAESASSDVVKKTLAGKWYEKIGLRGYTQFRYGGAFGGEGVPLEMPADRTVNANESFLIRRGRMIFSGDVSPRVYLYAQSDFNASTGAADYSLQMRDLYADVALDATKAWRLRVGQSKVPFGWVNMQSSQNRAPLERPDAINSAAETERDLGAYVMWASPVARQRFRDLVNQGLKGSGDYGVVAVGAYAGQGPNRSDQNKSPHALVRAAYPFKLASGQFMEVGVNAYRGFFVSPVQPITTGGQIVTPARPADGVLDERVGATFVWYPQPFGVEAEWNVGTGPQLSDDLRRIESATLNGGYVQLAYRSAPQGGMAWYPFARWQYFDGGRKFARNSPHAKVNELELGVELARWAELELTTVYTRSFERARTNTFPYDSTRRGNRFAVQLQWNYP